MAGRRIIICMDGTGNVVGRSETNVLRLYKALRQDDDQVAHYVPGVGTFAGRSLMAFPPLVKTRAVLGLAFGMGLEDDVLDAYRHLCRHWRGPEDRIYIFGFSRGAYAARVLAGFIHNFGLLRRDYDRLLPAVFRAYRAITDADADTPDNKVFARLRQYEDVLDPVKSVPIRALGLFDTVSSIIRFRRPLENLRRYGSLVELGTHASVDTNPSVRIVRHALAVDERRTLFRAQHWQKTDYFGNRFRVPSMRRLQYVEQRWFPGFHADIGGSPPEPEAGIGKAALLWMLDGIAADEAAADAEDSRAGRPPRGDRSGIALTRGYRERILEGAGDGTNRLGQPWSEPDLMAPVHDSMKMAWWPLEFLPKSVKRRSNPDGRTGFPWYLPLEEPRFIPPNHVIDGGVHDRITLSDGYAPPNVIRRDG